MIEVSQNYTVGLPIAASTYAAKMDSILNLVHDAMLAIFVIWGVFFLFCLLRFRRGRNPQASYEASFERRAAYIPDVVILVFEIWLLFAVGWPLWAYIKRDFPSESISNVVELTGEQFAWNFRYPGPDGKFGRKDPKLVSATNSIGLDDQDPASKDDIVSMNELHVPLEKPTLIYLTSKDVVHSFFIPEFRVKQDVVPGMRVPVWFQPSRAGRYEIGCAQLCGLGHYRMRGELVAETNQEFETWLDAQAKAAREP
jgi:cytochrome c oxidase subunit 2